MKLLVHEKKHIFNDTIYCNGKCIATYIFHTCSSFCNKAFSVEFYRIFSFFKCKLSFCFFVWVTLYIVAHFDWIKAADSRYVIIIQ